MRRRMLAWTVVLTCWATLALAQQADPLPSWNDGKNDWKRIFAFEK